MTLLVAGCEAVGASTVGEGKHLRFRVRQYGRDAGSAIAFGLGGQLERLQAESRFDVAFQLKRNRWNGTVSPQLVVRRVFDTADAYEELRTWLADIWRAGENRLDAGGAAHLYRARSRGRGREAPAAGVGDLPRAAGARRAAAELAASRLTRQRTVGRSRLDGRASERSSSASSRSTRRRSRYRWRRRPMASVLSATRSAILCPLWGFRSSPK